LWKKKARFRRYKKNFNSVMGKGGGAWGGKDPDRRSEGGGPAGAGDGKKKKGGHPKSPFPGRDLGEKKKREKGGAIKKEKGRKNSPTPPPRRPH